MSRSEHGPSPAPDDAVAPSVVVHGHGVRVDRAHTDLPLAEVRSRFGGLDGWAVLAGLATALGTLLALSTALAAAGVEGGGQVDRETLSVVGIVAGLAALALSLLFGGYVAGRVARYSGLLNGLLTGIAFVLVTAALTALAAAAGSEQQLGLPSWLDRDTATTAAVVTGLLALALALGAATLGGRLGSRWHRRVDETLLGTRPGGVAPYPTEPVVVRSTPAGGAR
jgi:putative membrane protein (TIGR04086 family)